MNSTVFSLTLKQIAGRRRSLTMFGLVIVPILLALIFRLGEHLDQQDWTANVLLDGIILTIVLPLACLILGTSAFGSEVEDGTAVYILAKPIPRREIIIAKFAAAALVTAAFVVPATVISGLLALRGASEDGLVIGFAVAVTFGVAAYTGLFILLSVVTSRALLIGLAYVFIWEGIATELFTGTRFLSIRQYSLGIADLISSVRKQDFEANLGGAEGLILGSAVAAIALFLAVRRLERFELTETD
ncbi:MAG: ABC transporter permease subunit [Dehalococcoidia bacterium]